MSEIDTIIKKHFGDTQTACKVLGVTRQAISLWRINGIPTLRRYHVDAMIAKRSKRPPRT
jgi:hypothetical protein